MVTDLILGTAGHIDHGKTTLIKALTGVDADRLPEEKRRGITIDLGFAELLIGDYRLGIVDVPGHERLVRNMLAGATGMDLVLLVIAADDSVKPQTREHLEILRLLKLEAGVIALTKCDLADSEWIELVEQEIGELVEGTFLARAPIVRTSATTGEGLGQLRDMLTQAASSVASLRTDEHHSPFRMAIDRTFSIEGHGTVVTGSVSSGQVQLGDDLCIQPGAIQGRARGLQTHDRSVPHIGRGQRAAINLAGIHHAQVRRGHELASPGHLVPSNLLTVSLSLLKSATRPLKNRTRVRVHLGTAEMIATVRLLDGSHLAPGETAYAQLYLAEPAVSTWSQPFVLRNESPVVTIGGGNVLDPCANKIRRSTTDVQENLAHLTSDNWVLRASAALYFSGLGAWQPSQLAQTAGVHQGEKARQELIDRGDLVELDISPTRSVSAHRRMLELLSERIEAVLQKLHEQQPLRASIDRSTLVHRFDYLGEEPLISALLDWMQHAGRIELTARGVALAGHNAKLSAGEKLVFQTLVDRYRRAGFQPPTVKECQEETNKLRDAVPQLIALAAAQGELVEISREFYVHADTEQELRNRLRQKLVSSDGLTLSEIRGILETTRKYAVPLAEYLDRQGFTKRKGDLRVLAEG